MGKIGVNSDEKNIFQEVEIFTYSQYSLDTGELEQPPLTADYDQLTAGPVYMTIGNIDNEGKKKLWNAIDYITGLQNSELDKNCTIIDSSRVIVDTSICLILFLFSEGFMN